MFDRIYDLVVQLWERMTPLRIISAGQHAGVLRFGCYNRTLSPGIHWRWPFIEEINTQNTCVTTLRLEPQTITTKDGVSVVVAAIVKYQIKDVKPYITKVWDQRDVLADVIMGAIRKAVNGLTYDQLIASPPEQSVLDLGCDEVNKFGFKLWAVTFTDLGRIRSLRLIQHTAQRIDN